MSYAVKEIFYTLQGEGANAGRAAVFCRFAGCNLWSGREEDRADAVCRFCDTDFVGTNGPGGGRFRTAEALAAAVAAAWPRPAPNAEAMGYRIRSLVHEAEAGRASPLERASYGVAHCFSIGRGGAAPPRPLVVCTGGEPLLQLDAALVAAFHQAGFEVAVETNGTILPPPGIDWSCVSPKAGAELVSQRGDELKLVFPQEGAEPERYEDLDFRHFFLQPMDGPHRERNTQLAVRYCLEHPRWRLSLQTHKLVGLP